MFWITVLGLFALVIWLSSRGGSNNNQSTPPYVINQQWMDYLAASYREAKKPAEKVLLMRLLTDLINQGMPQPTQPITDLALAPNEEGTIPAKAALAQSAAEPGTHLQQQIDATSQIQVTQTGQPREPLDNATLLLYFGAFLFLAAAGLFVAIAGDAGWLRAGIVAATSLALYSGGLWLFKTKDKLRTPAQTFIGMGMMLAPLAGLATYAYVLKDQGPLVWFATSVACMGMYYHALRTVKNPLLEYIFLGTFVSLFESSIAVLQLPVYFYGWGLAVVALLFAAWGLAKGNEAVVSPAANTLANILVPASVCMALFATADFGSWQAGVSLLLAAVYYGLQAWGIQAAQERAQTAVIAQIAGSLGMAIIAYAFQHDFIQAGLALSVCGLLAALGCAWLEPATKQAMTTTGFVALFAAACLAWPDSAVFLSILAVGAIAAFGVWLRDNRPEMYVLAGITTLVLPFAYGMKLVEGGLSKGALIALVSSVLAFLIVCFLAARKTTFDTSDWRTAHQGVVTIAMVVLFATVVGSSMWLVIVAGIGLAIAAFALHFVDKTQNSYWMMISSLASVSAILFTWQDSRIFLAAVLLGWCWNLMLVLEHRLESARWVGSVAWLLVPAAIAHQWIWLQSAQWYSGAYLVSMLGFIVARYIAKKRLVRLSLSLAELEDRLKTNSISYVVGYVLAAAIASVVALDGVAYLPAIVALVLACAAYIVSYKVERSPEIMAAVPFLLQGGVWASDFFDGALPMQVALSSGTALILYVLASSDTYTARRTYSDYLRQAALFSAFIAPGSAIFSARNIVWAMPVSLIVAGMVLVHFSLTRTQGEREISGGVIVLGLLWLLYTLGVKELQVYTHLTAAVLALYAWWRAKRNEVAEREQYIMATLVTVTIPFALQLVYGGMGIMYGWWFLCEQVAIMLIGMLLNHKLITRWGLYAAILSVLYQLRFLAWLALAFLAIFLIGLAVYQIQKSDQK